MIRYGRRNEKEHSYFEERLSAYLDGELAAREHRAVEHHLKECEACRWELATLKQTVAWLSELPPVPVPRMFTIPANVVPAPPARRPRWKFVPAMQFATALAAVLLFFAAAGDVMLTGWPWGSAGSEPAMLQEAAVEESMDEMPAVRDKDLTVEAEMVARAEPYGEAGTGPAEEETAPEEPMMMMQAPTESVARAMAPTEPVTGEAIGGGLTGEQETPEDTAQPEAEAGPTLPSISLPETLTASTHEPLPATEGESMPTATPSPSPTNTRAPLPTVTRQPAVIVVPTITALPTIHPPLTEAVPPPAAIVQVDEPLPPAGEARDAMKSTALTSGESRAVFWLRIVEYVLGIALVVLAGTTIMFMILRRRARRH